ncbi:hypothetical protein ACEN9J_30005 [Variovorax sp. Varisp41]|uniref:hypothetical protein n=1 Tax=Variovorax sp. Varisp41 TaxID=3243033 RepID=UPI0039B514F3
MRTLFLALMIALLPVRGWLGDAMAIEMVRHSMPAAEAVAGAAQAATEAHCHEAGDMAMSAMDGASREDHAMADGHGDDGDHASHQGCGTCTACQVCHSVALGGTELSGIAHDAPQAAPAAPAARFASTEPFLGLKPPIS